MAFLLCALAVAVLALGAGCAPRVAPPGPGAATPALAADHLLTADGLRLPMRAWLPENPGTPSAVILALHGFNDYSNAFEDSGRYWASRGFATYAYDQRGFGAAPHSGLWPGIEALTDDLCVAIAALRQRHPGIPLFALGESMGGAVILTTLAQGQPPAIDGVILVAPAVWARRTMPFLQRAGLWLGAHTVPWLKVSGRNLDIQASDNVEMLRALGRDPLVIKETRIDAIHGLVDLMDQALAAAPELEVPALLLYGEKDEIIPEDPTLRLWLDLPDSARPSQRHALYPDGWHMLLRDLQAKVVWNDIAHWIEDAQTALPSGAESRALARLSADAE